MRVIEVKKLTEINLQDYLHASNSNKTELARFAYHIQGKIRGVKFGIRTRNTMDDVQCRLHVYYPDDKYAMGHITYFTLEGLGFYTVNARDIYNERSRNSSPNMKKSQNIQVALRTACKFLKRFTPLEEVCCSHEKLDGRITGLISADRREFSDVTNILSSGVGSTYRYRSQEDIPDQASFINEIRNILAQHDFADPGVKAVFTSLITTYDNVQVAEALCKDTYTYVRLVEGERVVMMSGVPAPMYSGNPAGYYDGVITRTTHDQVPEHIQNAVTTLFLLSDGEFVKGLGLRVDESTYYVLEPRGN